MSLWRRWRYRRKVSKEVRVGEKPLLRRDWREKEGRGGWSFIRGSEQKGFSFS